MDDRDERLKFHGRVALVTGGGSGIGRAIAERLARDGATVLVVGRDMLAAEQAVAGIRNEGGKAHAIKTDISQAASVFELFKTIERDHGGLDIAVNNAGAALHKPFVETTDDEWKSLLDVNATGAFLVLRGAARLMLDKGNGGRIVVVGTGAAMQGLAGRAAYGATKVTQFILTRTLALELGPFGITVNAVAPGPIDTEQARTLRTPATLAAWTPHLAIKRYGTTAEVASAVAFLASDEASYITGEILAVDGGFMAGVEVREGGH